MKGTYLLLIELARDLNIKIGALGRTKLGKGRYVYVGSALNSLEKRIERHFRGKKKKHWHIDYLLSNKNTRIKSVYYKESRKRIECITAREIARKGIPVKGFGCSDCNCNSHFFRVKRFPEIKGFKRFKE